MLTPTGIITPSRVNDLIVCTAGEFVLNEGGVVPATCALYHVVLFVYMIRQLEYIMLT